MNLYFKVGKRTFIEITGSLIWDYIFHRKTIKNGFRWLETEEGWQDEEKEMAKLD